LSRQTLAIAGLIVILVAVGVVLSVLPGQGYTGPPNQEHPPASPVDGIVLSVDSQGLTNVKGFTLRTIEGYVLTFTLGQLENGAQFAPGHLGEHQATALPVRVFFRQANGQLVVYRLEDAPIASPVAS
jgi:hypothetical protein